MPPRYSYWTIIAGGLPTAFRAAERDDLMPTFKRIQEKHPDAEMKWFARGKLWESPEAAREDTEARRRPPEGHRAPVGARPPARPGERRGRDWRPGGEHRDPRQKFKDAKKKGNQDRRQERFDRKQGRAETPGEKPPESRPPSDRPVGRAAPPHRASAAGTPVSGPPRRAQQGSPHKPEPGEKRDWRDRPPREKPHGDPLRRDVPPAGRAPFKARPPFQARPPFKARPPFNPDAPPRDRDNRPDDPKPWRAAGGKPRSGSGSSPRPSGRRDDRPRGPKPPRSGGGGGGRR